MPDLDDLLGRAMAWAEPQYLAERKALGALPVLTQARTHYLPKGVVGIVAPWNYPLSMSITDALPALAAGNAVVLRPDEKSSFTCLRAVELCDEAGLPEGLLQVVLGDGPNVGGAVLEHADSVMFTGSTKTGRIVARDAGERLKSASLELGGKNAMYIADDADLTRAAECAQRAVFASAGQLCISIERLVVHEKIADEFLRRFLERVAAMKIGVALDWGYDMGSLISADQLERVTQHVDDAVAKGATVLAGGKARPEIGPYCYEPTVLDGVADGMLCRDEETFGPVVSVYRVSSDDEAVALAASLATKRARLDEALEDLRRTDTTLWKRANEYSSPTKRNAEEQQRLAHLGLSQQASADGGEVAGSRMLAKKRARLMARTRLATLFPRELRAPTMTPPTRGWPSYAPDEE